MYSSTLQKYCKVAKYGTHNYSKVYTTVVMYNSTIQKYCKVAKYGTHKLQDSIHYSGKVQ